MFSSKGCRWPDAHDYMNHNIYSSMIHTKANQHHKNMYHGFYRMPYTLGLIGLYYIASLVPRPPPFYLPFAFTIIHGSERPAKNGEGLGAFIT